jgi:hypothetical protein
MLMTDVENGPRRVLPQTTVQLVGHATSELIGGVSRTPMMLAVLLLNVIGIGSAVYFLNLLISGQQAHLKALLEVQDKQQTELVVLHKHVFDTMVALLPKMENIPPITPTPLPATPPQRGSAR